MIYLIRSEIEVREYMKFKPTYQDDIRLVEADSLKEAAEKYEKFWEKQNREYDVSFNVGTQSISEMIV